MEVLMKISFLLFAFLLIMNFGCSSTETRNPASIEQEKESAHEKFQGVFDRQY